MEKLLIMVSILSFLLAASLFIVELVRNGWKDSNFRPALWMFVVYIVSIVAFLIIFNVGGR
ncbi:MULTISPECIES: hypothetical protein [Gracilibacillus]|uniref:hypothetical protein n=1 Tax=Gracilibacillus TaxID=74385 RepID=UPI000826EC61|nr:MULTISPECIES: hypothetical protein [Gracilibacillus]